MTKIVIIFLQGSTATCTKHVRWAGYKSSSCKFRVVS